LLSKLYEVLVCACTAKSFICTRISASMKQNALSELCGTCCCFVHYINWKFESLFFCWSWDCS